MKHFTIFDFIASSLILMIMFGLAKLAHNDYINSDYIGMGLYLFALFGFIWVVIGVIKENKEDRKESRG